MPFDALDARSTFRRSLPLALAVISFTAWAHAEDASAVSTDEPAGENTDGQVTVASAETADLADAPSNGLGSKHVWIGVERVTGIFLEHQSASFQPSGMTGVEQTDTQSFTTIAVLGNDAATPSSLPRLALDIFITPAISLGGSFTFASSSMGLATEVDNNGAVNDTDSDGGSVSVFVLAPRAGYALPFSDDFGLWGRGGLTLARSTQSTILQVQGTETMTLDTSTVFFDVTLEALFYYQVGRHFIVNGGPFLDLGLLGSRSTDGAQSPDTSATLTSYGLTLGLAVAP